MKHESRPKPATKDTRAEDPYSKNFNEYEKLMRHDTFKRVKGRVRQTKWTDHS
ncbi:hypothetical protein [Ferroacidibacillus organovorans]|uniref:hypothetical protein n=1 Tax=Ferroacidibacillus organovorans TaxID=1765683 RepID=UPI0013665BAA|nr:hypothetical protein [Ferroacidibacillus organovorans]